VFSDPLAPVLRSLASVTLRTGRNKIGGHGLTSSRLGLEMIQGERFVGSLLTAVDTSTTKMVEDVLPEPALGFLTGHGLKVEEVVVWFGEHCCVCLTEVATWRF